MRAMLLETFDGPDRFREVQLDRPVAAPTEILVEVVAVGLNPVEWNASAGGWLAQLHGGPPLRLGWDIAGRVVEVGYGVTRVQPGDEVFGLPRFPHPAGGYAEYVAAPSRHFAPKPAGLSFVEAAGLPIAGLTAWQALVDVADVQPGQRVLVTAAAGGVGHLAVQIAKARGAWVIGTARSAKHPFLDELGVDQAIDYRDGRLSRLDQVDVVVDLVGDDDIETLVDPLTPGGVLVSVAGPVSAPVMQAASTRGVRATELLVEPDLAGLRALAALVEAGQLRVAVAATYPLEQVAAAHDAGRTGRSQGKIVLTVRP